jgi:nitroreductase
MEEKDIFQKRYEEHQTRKKEIITKHSELSDEQIVESESFISVIKNRRSQRVFNEEKVSDIVIESILEVAVEAPTSCNRQAVYFIEVSPDYVEKFLVGGKNWANKANRAMLVFADKLAYKSPNEKGFMPYLDAGFVSQNVYLGCEYFGIGCCFINPNIRAEDRESFEKEFGDNYFCGAFVLGRYDVKAKKPNKMSVSEIKK